MNNTKETLIENNPESFAPVTRTDQKAEATKRLKLLIDRFNLDPQILRHWKDGHLSCYFEGGSLLQAESIPQYFELISKFEQQFNSLVYHAVKTGSFLTRLFVDQYAEDWPFFSDDELLDGHITAYVYNPNHKKLSEMCFVRPSSHSGRLVRIA